MKDRVIRILVLYINNCKTPHLNTKSTPCWCLSQLSVVSHVLGGGGAVL